MKLYKYLTKCDFKYLIYLICKLFFKLKTAQKSHFFYNEVKFLHKLDFFATTIFVNHQTLIND